MLLMYLKVFLVGGFICFLGQILVIKTKITTARILVLFLLIGSFLGAIGVYDTLVEFAGAAFTVPILGFGGSIANGAIKAVSERGIIGALSGGMISVSAGLSAAIFFAFLIALIFNPKTKKN